jgi:hypothetical protein
MLPKIASLIGEDFNLSSAGGKYEGSWVSDLRHGQGRMVMEDKTVYEGEWREDVRQGRGKQNYLNGQHYEVRYVPPHPPLLFQNLSAVCRLALRCAANFLCKKKVLDPGKILTALVLRVSGRVASGKERGR